MAASGSERFGDEMPTACKESTCCAVTPGGWVPGRPPKCPLKLRGAAAPALPPEQPAPGRPASGRAQMWSCFPGKLTTGALVPPPSGGQEGLGQGKAFLSPF